MRTDIACLAAIAALCGAFFNAGFAAEGPQPVARWTLDEPSEPGVYVGTGKAEGKPMVAFGKALPCAAHFGGGVELGEGGGGLEAALSLSDIVAGEFTVMFWVMIGEDASGTGYGELVSFGGQRGCGIRTMQHLRIDVNMAGRWHFVATGNQPKNEWVQVAYVFDGARGTLHVNGTAVTSESPLESEIPAYGDKIGVGTVRFRPTGEEIPESEWPANSFIGQIDDLRIYDRVLTGEEIEAAAKP
jgi:hypothetical protein